MLVALSTDNTIRNPKCFCITTTNSATYENTIVKNIEIIDHKQKWKNQIQHVVAYICIAKDLLRKLRLNAPLLILKNVYYISVNQQLQFRVNLLGNTSAKFLQKIEVPQNLIVKIIIQAPFLRTKVAFIYQRFDFLTLNNTVNLEVLKFVF